MRNRHGSREFQRLSVLRLEEVLRKHGYANVRFERVTNNNTYYCAEIEIQGETCELQCTKTLSSCTVAINSLSAIYL